MKMLKKTLVVLMISLFVLALAQPAVLGYNWGGQIDKMAGKAGDSNVTGAFTNISGAVITIARIICMGVAITMLVLVAIKYMTAAPGEKADIKKHAVIYVVGAVVMFASTGILGIIQKFATGIK